MIRVEDLHMHFGGIRAVDGVSLEIASGTGEHGAWMTERFDALRWTYSDLDEMSRDSQRAWVRLAASGNTPAECMPSCMPASCSITMRQQCDVLAMTRLAVWFSTRCAFASISRSVCAGRN